MKARCPSCGLEFEREEGAFLGAYVINHAMAGAVVAVVLVAVIAIEASDPGANLLPLLMGGVVAAAAVPVIAYPWSRTIWIAIELVMRPLDPRELAGADQAQAEAQARAEVQFEAEGQTRAEAQFEAEADRPPLPPPPDVSPPSV